VNILTICHEYPPVGGGGATFCRALSEFFSSMGHRVDVVTSRMRGLPEYEQSNRVHIHRVPCIRRYRHYSTFPELCTQLWPSYRKATQLLRDRHYDVGHCHFVVPSGIVAHALWTSRRLPYVLTAHGSDIPGYNPDRFGLTHSLIRPVWKRIIQNSSSVTTPSVFLSQLIRHQIAVPVEVIPYGFTALARGDIRRQNRILVASRMVKRKGFQFFIQALKQIDTDWETWIVGDGPYLPTLKRMSAEAGLDTRFLGFVPRDELWELYQSARIFVFPSIQENFPLVLLEAMAAGCAVVTTSAPGCVEVVGDAALKVEPSNPGALRDAVSGLLGNEAQINELAELGRQRAALFSWDRIAPQYEALFLEAQDSDTQH